MAFAGGPVSFQRFLIEGSLSRDVDERFVAALRARAFGSSPPQPDDTQCGWIGPRHVFDTELAGETIACGAYVHVGVRLDKLSAPPSVLRAYVRMEEDALRQTGGRALLSRAELRRAREAARERAGQEARAGDFRRIAAYPVLIDLEHQQVFLGTLSLSAADKVLQLFHATFGCGLVPADPERCAMRVLERGGDLRKLENLAPFTLVRAPRDGEPEFEGVDANFLGKEFLTWLWYRIDADTGPLKIHSGDEVTVMIDKVLRLKCDFGLTGTDVITADGPANLPEARAALASGKQPTKMGLLLGCPLGEFRFTLEGPRLAVSGLIVPEEDGADDPRARLERRFELIADTGHLLDALFELFVAVRTGRKWNHELRDMSAWAAGQAAEKPRAVSA